MWKVMIDCHLTRRKRFHQAVDPSGLVQFTARRLGEIFEFLEAEGIREVWIQFEGKMWFITLDHARIPFHENVLS